MRRHLKLKNSIPWYKKCGVECRVTRFCLVFDLTRHLLDTYSTLTRHLLDNPPNALTQAITGYSTPTRHLLDTYSTPTHTRYKTRYPLNDDSYQQVIISSCTGTQYREFELSTQKKVTHNRGLVRDNWINQLHIIILHQIKS